jgi:hypothetical protein
MLARATGADGEPLRLEGIEQARLEEGLRVVRSIGAEHEFRHDQMRALLAALC